MTFLTEIEFNLVQSASASPPNAALASELELAGTTSQPQSILSFFWILHGLPKVYGK